MSMTLEELLQQIRRRQLILISDREIWPAPGVTPETRQAIRKHRRQLAALINGADIRTCASPAWHRKYWRYVGHQVYECEACRRLDASAHCVSQEKKMAANPEHMQPAMTFHQARTFFADMPLARIAEVMESTIATCKNPEAVRRELAGAEWADPFWLFYGLDVLERHKGKLAQVIHTTGQNNVILSTAIATDAASTCTGQGSAASSRKRTTMPRKNTSTEGDQPPQPDASAQKKALKEWRAAKAHLDECEAELLNAQSMQDKPRIAQCQRWVAEAKEHERAAYDSAHRAKGTID